MCEFMFFFRDIAFRYSVYKIVLSLFFNIIGGKDVGFTWF